VIITLPHLYVTYRKAVVLGSSPGRLPALPVAVPAQIPFGVAPRWTKIACRSAGRWSLRSETMVHVRLPSKREKAACGCLKVPVLMRRGGSSFTV
jgi:hypothetical protein